MWAGGGGGGGRGPAAAAACGGPASEWSAQLPPRENTARFIVRDEGGRKGVRGKQRLESRAWTHLICVHIP